ncbi:hypothetical protein [Alicyclobacillus dauci]|uniref:Uncharacterized protein n=1 Tax=Alicyclobacillus dauci TaxID=1475485 RepID=A0ABY6Z0E1_9BACL|nr:hypothetical protein [Alicyclobacillus dauci]WAH36338.1 hypothetical protein NZD86_19230 [Alicyclobacillus dauci]WAH39393.1 hypothetical protein NZD86_23825 [Alicyclobacillus dauci]
MKTMRIVSFLNNNEERIGVELPDGFLDLNLACRSMLAAQGNLIRNDWRIYLSPQMPSSFSKEVIVRWNRPGKLSSLLWIVLFRNEQITSMILRPFRDYLLFLILAKLCA